MDPLYYLTGGALLGVLASFWSKIKAVLWRIANVLVQQVEIPTEEAHNALVAFLIKNYKRSRAYERMYGASYEHYRNGKYGLVPYEQYGTRGMIFWKGWVPFFFSNAVESKAKAGRPAGAGSDDATKVYSTITFFRSSVNVEEILRHACDAANNLSWSVSTEQEQAKNRFVIHYVPKRETEDNNRGYGSNGLAWYQQGYYRLLSHKPDELGKVSLCRGSALENLIFPTRVKDLIKEIELWRNNRDWYVEKGIPWKRGWMLYGPPGTGKTALARAFAEDLNLPIYVFNLAEMSNHELLKAWTDMQVNVPCVALIEDIDNVFHGRENVARKNGMMPLMFSGRGKKDKDDDNGNSKMMGSAFTPLTFDCLLNCLDGVERVDGVFTIITTNEITKVDPALGQPRQLPDGTTEFISTRPGRVDKAVELSYMEPDDKKKMAKRILCEYPDEFMAMVDFVDKYPSLQETPAQFQERCGQIALACFWKEKERAAQALQPTPTEWELKEDTTDTLREMLEPTHS